MNRGPRYISFPFFPAAFNKSNHFLLPSAVHLLLHTSDSNTHTHNTLKGTAAVRCVWCCNRRLQSDTDTGLADHDEGRRHRYTLTLNVKQASSTLFRGNKSLQLAEENTETTEADTAVTFRRWQLCSDHRGTVLLLFYHRLIKRALNNEMDLTVARGSGYFT